MGIIDKKGMLFSKINLFDLVMISFAVFVVSFIIINTTFRGQLFKKIADVPDFEYALIDVILPEESSWMQQHIKKGDIVEGSSFRELTATVLDVKEVSGFGQNKRVMVKIKSFVAKDRQGTLSYGKNPLRVGEEIPFFTPKYIFYGRITDIKLTGEKIILKD